MSNFLSDAPVLASDLRKLDKRLSGELAAAVGDNANFVTTVTNSLAAKADAFSVGTGLTMTSGVLSSNVTQGEVDEKEDTITGAATTLTGSNLASNRALVSNGNGKVVVSAVTSTELGYLDGLVSNLQDQLDLLKPSACKMYRNTNQTPAGGMGEILTYTHTEYTYGGRVSGNQSNGRFTVNTAGVYVYTGTCTYSTGVRLLVNIKINGNYIAARQGGKPYDVDEGVTRAMSWSTDLVLSANDYAETLIWNNNSGKDVQGYSCLRWVGPQ